jgi:hypothetical protein
MYGQAHQGFTFVFILFLLALLSVGLGALGQVWHTTQMREKEVQLLFVGGQFRQAIILYHKQNPNVGDGFPKTLDELLQDAHQPTVQRYLRKIYVDPFSNTAEWGLIKTPAGGIVGVYSLAKGVPMKQAGFRPEYEEFTGAESYTMWRFVAPQTVVAVEHGPTGQLTPVVANAPTAPPESPVPALPPIPARKPGQPPDCNYVAALDARTCALEQVKWGSATLCIESARARADSCALGVAPPDLPSLQVRMGAAP